MIIQHNIMALNSYNRLASNNSTVAKNIEKLSSGYKINRAGDDAAGLAISEKMRAQVTGLERAKQNAQDGVSLVQTAEGQLTEVHSMLNRMVDLATQSSNGTYDNDVDRKNLQLEVQSLKDEIDRIAETSNFNGIKLLDGSLGSSSAAGVAVDVKFDGLTTKPGVLTLKAAGATKGGTAATNTATLVAGDKYSIEVTFADANGTLQKKTVEFTAADNGAVGTKNNTVIENALKDAFGDGYNVTYDNTGKLDVVSKTAGAGDKMEIFSIGMKDSTGTAVAGAFGAVSNTAGADAYYDLDITALGQYTGAAGQKISDFVFEINGEKFAITDAAGATAMGKEDPSVNTIVIATGAPATGDRAAVIKAINDKTGIAAANSATATAIALKAGVKSGTTGRGLSLQIGDTADQRVTVEIDNMGTKALGLSSVDVSSEKAATASMKVVKTAINTVSTQRAKLGAVQNRLEHTISNLTTTAENMTAAESRIRDTDMAKEMMMFTKNNVLSQAAQAMLAQANQQPQQVLQLLR